MTVVELAAAEVVVTVTPRLFVLCLGATPIPLLMNVLLNALLVSG